MLQKPDLPDEKIIICLQEEYGLHGVQVAFLPLGADRNTAVYRATCRATTDDATAYFVKLRSGTFDELTIIVPKWLHDQGIQQIIAPLLTRSQQLWTSVDNFKLTVSPFVEGHNGYEIQLEDSHWVDFGRALKAIHAAEIPSAWGDRLQREDYSSTWRERVKAFQALAEQKTVFSDAVAEALAAFLKLKQQEIDALVQRAEDLASVLEARPQPFVLCHADIHAGNILIDTSSQLYIVDWDTLIFAPKERDLMYAGGGLFANTRSPKEESALFYQGYGQTEIDQNALDYYRCERIVQDIVAYSEQLLLTDEGGHDREQGLRELTAQFLPDHVVDIALR